MPCASTFVQIATECSMPSYFSFRALAFASLALMAATGCKKDEPAPAKPAVLASALASAAAPIAPAPKPAAKPAAVKSVPAEKLAHPVPTDWVEINEEKRGFSFSMPKGSTAHAEDKNGVAAYIGILPAPNDKVAVMVVAYKDAKKTSTTSPKRAKRRSPRASARPTRRS